MIGAAIVGLNHVKVLAECQLLASVLLWMIAVGTVAVTLRSVVGLD